MITRPFRRFIYNKIKTAEIRSGENYQTFRTHHISVSVNPALLSHLNVICRQILFGLKSPFITPQKGEILSLGGYATVKEEWTRVGGIAQQACSIPAIGLDMLILDLQHELMTKDWALTLHSKPQYTIYNFRGSTKTIRHCFGTQINEIKWNS